MALSNQNLSYSNRQPLKVQHIQCSKRLKNSAIKNLIVLLYQNLCKYNYVFSILLSLQYPPRKLHFYGFLNHCTFQYSPH